MNLPTLVSSSKYALRIALFAAFAVVLCAISYGHVFEEYELQTYDWRCRLRGPRPVAPQIAIIHISDDTLANIGAWPFSRDYHARLIQVLKKHGAKAILFDVLFVEPHPGEDEKVAGALRAADNVYLAYALSEPKGQHGQFESAGYLADLITPYKNAAKSTGFVNVVADIDGKRRRVIPVIRYGQKEKFYIALEVARELLGVKESEVSMDSRHRLHLGNKRTLWLDEQGYLPINFAGRWKDTFRHYSYYEILLSDELLQNNQPPIVNLDGFKDAICIVGHTATATHDVNATPLEPIYPNVGIHANVLNSILNNDFITRIPRSWNVLLLLLLNAWVAWNAFYKRPLVSFVRVLLTLALAVVGAVCVFIRWGVWADLFLPFISGVVIYTMITFLRTIGEMRKRESIEKELQIASQIQNSFLPQKAPEHRDIQIAVFMKPAKQVGGDLYAFTKLDGNRLGVMVGDVSGKGTPAALFMAKTVSEFKFSAREKSDPAEVLLSLNESIAAESTGGLFVTLGYAVFDPVKRKLLFSNGGHLPVISVSEGGICDLVNSEEGLPIGVLPGVRFGHAERVLKKGDIYAFYSDGVSEARNARGQEYTSKRLQSFLSGARFSGASEILQETVDDVLQFVGKSPQHDDMTLIIVKITS